MRSLRLAAPSFLVLLILLTAPGGLQAQGAPSEGLPAEDAALLLSGQSGGALPLAVKAVPVEPDPDGGVDTHITVELPVASLLGDTPGPIGIRLAVYVVDDTGALVGSRVTTRTTDPERLAASGASGVRWIDTMTLPAGALSVRVLVRLLSGEKFGLRILSVDLTPPQQGWFSQTLPVGTSAGWIEPTAPEATQRASVAAMPVVQAGQPLQILLVGPGAESVPSFELRPEDGSAPAQEIAAKVVSSEAASGGWRRETVEVAIPQDIGGRYTLQQKGASAQVHVIIVGPHQAQATTWPELMFPGNAPEQTAQGQTAPLARGRVPRHATRAALERGVEALAADGIEAGEKELSGGFDALWKKYGSDGLQGLIAAGMQVGGELADANPESLPPLITTTDRLYRSCLEQKRFACSSAARRLTIGLLDLYSTSADTSRSLAAAAWTGMGAQLLEAGLWQRANAVLERALKSESGYAPALLAMGELHERVGDYAGARDAYARLVRSQPQSAEARLRLGVQLIRLGQEKQGIEQLQRAAESKGPDWVRTVAWEQWASTLLAEDGAGPAEAVLEKAREAFPESEQLKMQMAALLDRRGRGGEASHLIESLSEPTGARSPRNLYTDWPKEALDGARRQFRDGATERLPTLRQALQGAG